MQLRLRLIFLFTTLSSLSSFGQRNTVNADYPFRKYPARIETTRVDPRSLIFTETTYHFKTRIVNALKAKPNFAGHCIVVEWGCGTSCQQSVIINLKTKKVFFGPNSSTGFIYSPESKLLVSNPVDKETPDYISKETSFYLLEGNTLKLIKKVATD